MSRVRADNITNKDGTGAPSLSNGAVVTGVLTATSLSISGNVSIAGTLTYEDVTNVDSIGIITARSGIQVLANGLDITGVGTFNNSIEVAGVVTATSAGLQATNIDLSGLLREKINVTAGKLSDNTNINLDNGMVHLFTTTETTTAIPNIMSTTGINTDVQIGEAISVTILTTAAAAGYAATVHIDGLPVATNGGTLNWTGGSAPSDGGSSGVDIYSYTIMKTASATYTVIAAQTKTS